MKIFIVSLLLFAAVQAHHGKSHSEIVTVKRTFPVLETAPKPKFGQRIINGETASRGQFPYQAALIIDGSIFCGGSLIDTNTVLTAAHCTVDARQAQVYLGAQNINSATEEGREIIRSASLTPHAGFSFNTAENDVAIIKLSSAVTESEYISPIALASGSDTFEGVSATVSGWGKTSDSSSGISSQLKYVSLPILPNDDCASYYGSIVIDSMICADGATGSTCNGDSGGPLVYNGEQIGIVSWGSDSGCESGYPAVFTRVSSFTDWIAQNSKH